MNQSENGHAFLASSGNHSGLSQHTGPVNGGCLLCVSFILRVGCADLKIIGWGMHEIFHRNTAIGSRYHSADRHRHINAGIAGHSADRVRSWMLDIGAVVDCERIMLTKGMAMDWNQRQTECKKCGGMGYVQSEMRHEDGSGRLAWAALCECQPRTFAERAEAAEQEAAASRIC